MKRFRLHPLRNSGYQLVEDDSGEYGLLSEVREALFEELSPHLLDHLLVAALDRVLPSTDSEGQG